MDDQPFYELDEDELVIEEATEAALSASVRASARATEPERVVGVVLLSRIDQAAVARFSAFFELTVAPSLLDHALFVNALSCALSADGRDTTGLAALLRRESAYLELDRTRRLEAPRSEGLTGISDALTALVALPVTSFHLGGGPAVRFARDEFERAIARSRDVSQFVTLRRLTVALVPHITKYPETADRLRDYAIAMRLFVSEYAARRGIQEWSTVAQLTNDEADRCARALLTALPGELI